MSLKKLKLLFVRFTNMIYDALAILESFCTMIALENILELIWELPPVQCSWQMISLKQLMMMMRKWQKPLLQLSWPWLPGAEQLFTPSRLALGDEADEEEGRQGKGEEGKEGGSRGYLEDQGCS